MLDGMTNIKASEVLKEIKYYTEDLPPYSPDEVAEALDMAIKALEAQPTHGSTYGGVSWGGTYRDATEEERKSVKDYVESISKPTGVRFDTQPTDAKETIIKSALKYLVKMQIEQGSVGFAVDNDHDHDCCWDDVLAWIEAQSKQPCEEAVSREAVQDLISRWLSDYLLDETREALETINYKIGDMPPVTPQRKMGRWIDFNWNDGDICRWGIKCSECHTEYKHGGEMWHNPKFCPNCGAEMGGEENA